MSKHISDKVSTYRDVTKNVLSPNTPICVEVTPHGGYPSQNREWFSNVKKSCDLDLMNTVAATTQSLCQLFSGVKLAYATTSKMVFILTDSAQAGSQHMFGGIQHRIESAFTSQATVEFNDLMCDHFKGETDLPFVYISSHAYSIPQDDLRIVCTAMQRHAARAAIIAHINEHQMQDEPIGSLSLIQLMHLLRDCGSNVSQLPKDLTRGIVVAYGNDEGSNENWNIVTPPLFSDNDTFIDEQIERRDELLRHYANVRAESVAISL